VSPWGVRTATTAVLLASLLALTGCSVSVERTAAPDLDRLAAVSRPEPSSPEPTLPGPVEPAPSTTEPTATEPETTEPEATEPSVTPAPVDPGVEPAAAPALDAEPVPEVAEEPEPDDGQLRQGDSGPEVLAVQQRLSELGYWLGTPDGSFGALTSQAVMALQKAAGLQRDAVVGPQTLAALEAGTRPEARAGGDGVEIDLERQLLLVVRDGQVRTVLNTSTGVVGRYDTPPGRFTVLRAIDGLRVAPLGELWRPRYFNGGIAVHGSPSIPAHPASHGCARLSDAAIDMIWAEDLMPIGSTVTVY
jgi:peptidoglycan hydrolase-like protein with peptidoglycan-binding domain